MFMRWIVTALFVAFLHAPVSNAGQTLTVNTVGKAPFSTVLDALLQEAFLRIGVGLKTQELPGVRALKNANDGIEDGDAGRVRGTEKRYPNLVMIPEKFSMYILLDFPKL